MPGRIAARQVLADLERKAERVRAGLISPAEARTAEHLTTPIAEHVAAYVASLEASRGEAQVCEGIAESSKRCSPMRLRTLAALDREAVEPWLNRHQDEKVSGRTRNIDLIRG